MYPSSLKHWCEKPEFEELPVDGDFYWNWRDVHFLPYLWLEKKDIPALPTPFFVWDMHPDSPVGFESDAADALTNIIALAQSFDALGMDADLRKDLRRLERKNESVALVENEKGCLRKSAEWFLEFWKEEKADFERRLSLWEKHARTLSAYAGEELLGVHICLDGFGGDAGTTYYLGCWWNRKHKSRSIATFLLAKDIANAIRAGKKFYDLGVGDEPYKKQWGVIERKSKYFAKMPAKLAGELGLKKFEATG